METKISTLTEQIQILINCLEELIEDGDVVEVIGDIWESNLRDRINETNKLLESIK